MNLRTTPTVDAISELNFSGNIIPTVWYSKLKKTYRNKEIPYLEAIIILSEIIYWYRAREIRHPSTGKHLGTARKFQSDKLQKSYGDLADQFGLEKNDVKKALDYLTIKGLITKEFRTITVGKSLRLNNVLFIEPVPDKIRELNQPLKGLNINPKDDEFEICSDVSPQDIIGFEEEPIPSNDPSPSFQGGGKHRNGGEVNTESGESLSSISGGTNTKTTTKNTTKTTTESPTPPCGRDGTRLEVRKEALKINNKLDKTNKEESFNNLEEESLVINYNNIPTKKEVSDFCASKSITEELGVRFFNKMEKAGWTFKNRPVISWKGLLASFVKKDFERLQYNYTPKLKLSDESGIGKQVTFTPRSYLNYVDDPEYMCDPKDIIDLIPSYIGGICGHCGKESTQFNYIDNESAQCPKCSANIILDKNLTHLDLIKDDSITKLVPSEFFKAGV